MFFPRYIQFLLCWLFSSFAFTLADDPPPFLAGTAWPGSLPSLSLHSTKLRGSRFGDLIIVSIRKHFLVATPGNIFQPLKTVN